MTVDNSLYDQLADTWWADDGMLRFIQTGLNPVRSGYFREVLTERLGLEPQGLRALDVGCGGGLMAEEFARLGCRVVGIDPSRRSVAVAREHASRSDLPIDYVAGVGERLPFAGASFDIVYCCDTLEHVADVNAAIAETARVLKPGGVYLYDTINRTMVSNLAVVKLAQDWPLLRVAPPHLHDARMFIKPHELVTTMAMYGIENREIIGIWPNVNPLSLLKTIVKLKLGRITYPEAGRRVRLSRSRITWVSYMGYGWRGVR